MTPIIFFDYNNYPFNIRAIKPNRENYYVLNCDNMPRLVQKDKCVQIDFGYDVYNMVIPIGVYEI